MRRFVAIMILVVAGYAQSASAWDGSVTLIPTQIDVANAGNAAFRVITPSPACTGGPNWAYLEPTDSNYNAYVAMIALAKTQGTSVILYNTIGPNNWCHIGYITAY